MVQKTSRIGLAAILALMDWDFVTSLVSQAATQATLEVGDWKLAHKKETKKQKQTNSSNLFSGTERVVKRTANCFRN